MNHFLDHLVWNLGPGAWHEPSSALPDAAPTAHPVRLIAYYLPQLHVSPVNDQAWGKGFTEWTNVTHPFPQVAGQVLPWPEDDRTQERFQPLPRRRNYLVNQGRKILRRLGRGG